METKTIEELQSLVIEHQNDISLGMVNRISNEDIDKLYDKLFVAEGEILKRTKR